MHARIKTLSAHFETRKATHKASTSPFLARMGDMEELGKILKETSKVDQKRRDKAN